MLCHVILAEGLLTELANDLVPVVNILLVPLEGGQMWKNDVAQLARRRVKPLAFVRARPQALYALKASRPTAEMVAEMVGLQL